MTDSVVTAPEPQSHMAGRNLIPLLVLLSATCAILPPSAPEPTALVPPLNRPWPSISDRLLVEVNRARQRVGSPPLLAAEALDRVAHDYAAELARRGALDHVSPTPGLESMGKRIEAGGVSWRRAAENLGRRTGPAGDVAANIVAGWLASPGHAANMLEPAYTSAGTGVARDPAGMWFVVQLYVRPVRRD
jgi:uncharacterized protein YkwD